MKYRALGKTGVKVSVLGLGTWQYCGAWGKTFEEKEICDIFARAQELGFNLVDTAAGYGPHTSERLIGAALEGKRDNWVIVTKFGREITEPPRVDLKFDAVSVQKQLEDSLKALRTDHIDVYLWHSGENKHMDNDELWTMLDKQKQAGKVLHLGTSIHPEPDDNIYQTQRALAYGCEVIEMLYNRLDRGVEDGPMHICRDTNTGVLARVPLAQGYLSGKYKPGATFPENDLRHAYYQRNVQDERLQRAQMIQKYEVPEGVNMAAWAMAWSLRHPAVSACIPGFKSVAQLESGAAAADMVIDDHPLAVE